ncbi:MAG: hypothetical protein ABIH46_02530 [Chloroflexota bacterium]
MSSEDEHRVWTFPKCPCCGSKQRMAENVGKQEQKKGRVGEDFHPVLHQETTLIFDPRRTLIGPTRVPALLAHYDVCLECGCLYCIRVERGDAMVQPQMPGQPPVWGGRG